MPERAIGVVFIAPGMFLDGVKNYIIKLFLYGKNTIRISIGFPRSTILGPYTMRLTIRMQQYKIVLYYLLHTLVLVCIVNIGLFFLVFLFFTFTPSTSFRTHRD